MAGPAGSRAGPARAGGPARSSSGPTGSQAANLLGALALAVTDRCLPPGGGTGGHPASVAAALSALDQFLDDPSIDRLAAVVGLSQSGTVRLVDRLERDGLVRRGPGEDNRVTTVALTAAGRREARRIAAARLDLLGAALDPLSPSERRTLAVLAGKVLVGMMRPPGATRWTCRLCDLTACGRAVGRCPVEQAARARYGGTTPAAAGRRGTAHPRRHGQPRRHGRVIGRPEGPTGQGPTDHRGTRLGITDSGPPDW